MIMLDRAVIIRKRYYAYDSYALTPGPSPEIGRGELVIFKLCTRSPRPTGRGRAECGEGILFKKKLFCFRYIQDRAKKNKNMVTYFIFLTLILHDLNI